MCRTAFGCIGCKDTKYRLRIQQPKR
jgi:hypothetical protein